MASSTFRRYYLLSKPGIVYANVLTAAAGYLYASVFRIDFVVVGGLLLGLTLLIAGACAYNNYLDRGLDVAMARTKKRALVTGEVSVKNALTYATITTVTGLVILGITQNVVTLVLAVIAFIDYVILYGLGKRKTVHGTLIGTISGAIPLVAGYTAVTGSIDLQACLLFALMFSWQMAHFYAIALYRLDDYKAAKLPVLPVVHGAAVTKKQTMGYIGLFIASVLALITLGDLGILAGMVLIVLGVWWFVQALDSYHSLSAKAWGKQTFLTSLKVVMAISVCVALGSILF